MSVKKLKKGDLCVYNYALGASMIPKVLLCVVVRKDNNIVVKSLETNESFSFDLDGKEYPFDNTPSLMTVDDAKKQGKWRAIYDVVVEKHEKGEPYADLLR